MAYNDTEVELKFQIDKGEFNSIRSNLSRISGKPKTTKHVDKYFMPAHRDFLAPHWPFEWLSIRKRGTGVMLNYKHFYPESAYTHTHCRELETGVESMEKLERILDALDFRHIVTVEKERSLYECGSFDVALDTVRGLGHFIEIEANKDFGGPRRTRRILFSFARKIGVKRGKSEDKRGYPYLLMKKKGLISSSASD